MDIETMNNFDGTIQIPVLITLAYYDNLDLKTMNFLIDKDLIKPLAPDSSGIPSFGSTVAQSEAGKGRSGHGGKDFSFALKKL